ncbi:MAG: hypothetical protein I8H86_03695 [Sphingomonadaceae bacterium]|nr:hypothetical protein [Sphingomonadaceae bacterium]
MAELALPLSPADGRARASLDLLPLLCWISLAVGLLCRLFAGIDTPLWFDETYSAVIASQHNLPDLVRWLLSELSGPTYYSFLFLWEKVAGNGNIALRLPSLILSIATPLLILWRGHPDRNVRMLWAAITALSVIGFETATQARPYALLFLLASTQAMVFLRLIADPRTGTTCLWTSISALMVLTHYHAAVICGLQGIAYLALCRGRALRCWPALLPLVPMAVWMAWHLPFVFSYAHSDVVWYGTLGLDALWLIPSLLTGLAWPGVALLAAMAFSFGIDMVKARRGKAQWPYSAGETALVASGMLAITIVMGIGFIVPSFTGRYILPYVPALLAGVALWTNRMARHAPMIAAPLLCMMIGSAGAQLVGYIRDPQADFRYAFNFEQPSQWIAQHRVDRLVVLWDSPSAALVDPGGHIASVGSFFLHRAGLPIQATALPWPRTGDPNPLLIDMAGKDGRSAILWAYHANVEGTRGRVHPWRIPKIDPHWQCRDFGRAPVTVLACVPVGH